MEIAQALVDGIRFGLLIAMAAVGLSLVYGTTRLINFAHGELVTMGAVVAWYLEAGHGWWLGLATVVAVVTVGAFGGLLERYLWRPLRARRTGLFQLLIVSLGLSFVLRHVILIIFGGSSRSYREYGVQESVHLLGVAVTPRDLALIVISVLVLTSTGLMLERTPIGQAMRAVADNRDLAEASGVDVKRVILSVWILGAGLAALGGAMLGLSDGVSWDMGFQVLLLVFAGVILGGLGTAYGAMVGGLVIGIVTQLSTLVFPAEMKILWALVVLVLVLLAKPEGVLGRVQLKRVG
jgi:neutral amino acid transport system permease protein